MTSFKNRMGDDATDSGKKGWLVAILELGAWFGVLLTGACIRRGQMVLVLTRWYLQALSRTSSRASTLSSWRLLCSASASSCRPQRKGRTRFTEVRARSPFIVVRIAEVLCRPICHWSGRRLAQYVCPALQCGVLSPGIARQSGRAAAALHHLRDHDLVLD